MSRRYRILCGVPKINCTGSITVMSARMRDVKSHSSRDEAFRCYKRYLVKVEGYTQIGSREFRKEGHPIRVLTKRIRFGGMLRSGKSGEGGGAGRFMPENPNYVITG